MVVVPDIEIFDDDILIRELESRGYTVDADKDFDAADLSTSDLIDELENRGHTLDTGEDSDILESIQTDVLPCLYRNDYKEAFHQLDKLFPELHLLWKSVI